MNIRELIEEQRRRVNSSNPVERLAAALLIPSELTKRLDKLDDHEIGQLLDDEVGAKLSLFGPESTVCHAAVTRLRRCADGSPERKGLGIRRSERRSWTALRDEGKHVLNAEIALCRVGIPFLQLPWQMNRFASNTLMVTNIAGARACLLNAGFRETLRSPFVLVDSQTRQPIQLYEDRT